MMTAQSSESKKCVSVRYFANYTNEILLMYLFFYQNLNFLKIVTFHRIIETLHYSTGYEYFEIDLLRKVGGKTTPNQCVKQYYSQIFEIRKIISFIVTLGFKLYTFLCTTLVNKLNTLYYILRVLLIILYHHEILYRVL